MGQHEFDDSYAENDRRELEESWSGRAKRFEFNLKRDLPMLLYVRNATFVSNEQMCEVFLENKLEANRQCFRWRLQRLIEGKLIRVMDDTLPYKGRVYAITRNGLQVLETCGEGLVHLTSESRALPHQRQAAHFLELNEIRRTFLKTKTLKSWQTECELTSRNYDLQCPNAKDYDAVATLALDGNTFKVAIEYERTLKSSVRYREIMKALVDEARMDAVLYLAPKVSDVLSLASDFRQAPLPMLFACSWAFKNDLYATNVLVRYGAISETYTLKYALANIVLPTI